ncbi:hypothetical protein F2N05_24560, partial [Escherichia coli]|nr:hypothetical protein [Escherichia coli]
KKKSHPGKAAFFGTDLSGNLVLVSCYYFTRNDRLVKDLPKLVLIFYAIFSFFFFFFLCFFLLFWFALIPL